MSDRGGNLQVRYDEERDVVYVSIGDPRPGYGMPDEDMDSLVIRRDPKSHQVIGVTILGFRKVDRKKLSERLPFDIDFKRLGLA